MKTVEMREAGTHEPLPDNGGSWDQCARCGRLIMFQRASGAWVTMSGWNPACQGGA